MKKPTSKKEALLTIGAFARKAGISTTAVIGHINRGNIKTSWRKVRAIPESELERYLSVKKNKFGRRQIQESLTDTR